MKLLRLLRLAIVAAFVACNSAPQLVPNAAPQRNAAFTSKHLYVAQGADIASIVYRYPLRADGLPAKKPDGELDLDFRWVGSIAIGPDGDLYVTETGTVNGCRNPRTCRVDVFAPGASGKARPVRVLYTTLQPLYVAVDQRGYLDVETFHGEGYEITNVYRPNAGGHEKPIAQISSDGVNALAASHGIAYIQTLTEGVEAANEDASGKQPSYFTYGSNYSSDGVATDAKHLYAQYYWQRGSAYFLATAVFDIGHPGDATRSIIGTGCRGSVSGGALGYGLAVYKNYLYEGCLDFPGQAGGVLVYENTTSGKEKPLEKLPGGDAGLAIGP
ncbi:MAG TPA: hypothetical protein VKR56_00125 [Candidatus Cybelea sp.]|nr:hypothetical protein [Candidatus Cybelea sp.]